MKYIYFLRIPKSVVVLSHWRGAHSEEHLQLPDHGDVPRPLIGNDGLCVHNWQMNIVGDLNTVHHSFSFLSFFMTKLSRDQVNGISRAVISQKISLKRLGLSHNNLSFVSAELLAQAVIRLEEVELRSTRLDQQQMLSVCRAIEECPAPELRLRRLNLSQSEVRTQDLEHHVSKAEKKLASFGT